MISEEPKEVLMSSGKLFVISGPSGAGKGTICKKIVERGLAKLSVSMTTRAPRGAEIPGVSYYYVTQEEFDRTIAEDGFLEYAGIYNNRYGTPKKPVLDALAQGTDVVLEIEMQGAMKVREKYPEAILIFILPPSMKALKERLLGRKSETEEQLELRIKSQLAEIRKIFDYQYYVVNDDLDRAVDDVSAIIRSQHNLVCEETAELIRKLEEE